MQSIVAELDSTRDRTKAIHHDFLALIDIELGVYGRNREHLIHLPDEERTLVRKFLNDVALKKAQVANKLDQFHQINRLADQIQVEGRAPEAGRVRENATAILQEAQVAADKLATLAGSANSLLDRLSKIV